MERYGVDLVSDGTLLDALRTALDTGRAPEDLMPFTAEPEEDWTEELAAIEHPELRAHLGHFCTEGDLGLMPASEDSTVHGLRHEGCETVAGWEDGHGQIEITVIRLSDHVAGPPR
ncbi:hypothetical protein ACFWP2_19765 [Kitasatospora sp. NPDC058444]|uniref:hypothetical protein n=1 Tax=Kitasatospora sp. NPDC058444 TaxID=3346504 RepID=UPI0036550B3D